MKSYKMLFLGFVMILALLSPGQSVSAGTIYESPYVSFSPSKKAFTTNAGDKTGTWYTEKDSFYTGVESSIRSLNLGEHYYKTDRAGKIPVGEWRMSWRPGVCCHDNYPPADKPYHGISFRREICSAQYYSGWIGYCADCKEKINSIYMYMSKDAAKTITELDMDLEYYYLCPFCTNLEQGAPMGIHMCDKISWNKYKVIYDKNTISTTGGYMEMSIHMYNNESEFEGEIITPQTKLSKNAYTRIGYEFIGWNTKPDGSGDSFTDEALTWNLTSENFEGEGSSKGVITLYAQWKKSESTLHIDPAGGTYEEKAGISSFKKMYGEKYTPDSNKLVAPKGFQVSFDTKGGRPIDSILGDLSFVEWSMSVPFHGRFLKGVYFYTGKNDTSDTFTATYRQENILLPSAEKDNSSFGGWYYDPEGTLPAGSAGEEFTPESNVTLYAKWVDLVLTAVDNYTADAGRGAVDLTWEQKDDKKKTYLLFQSRDNVNWTKVSSAEDIAPERKIEEIFYRDGTYTVPYAGLYTLSAAGAQGGNYEKNKGGLGGTITGTVWLDKGEKLTLAIGRQDGAGGGGKGTMYAGGGGYTLISSDRQGELLIAGGGGGATSQGSGGVGGSTAGNLPDGKSGQDGGAGGGGGYRGGIAGEYITHTHTAACFREQNLDYILFNKKEGTGSHNAHSYVTGSFHSGGTDRYGSGGHTANGGAEALYDLGLTDVKGNTTLNIHGYFEILGQAMFRYVYGDQAYDGGNCYIRVLDQDGREIYRKRVYDLPRYGSVSDLQRGTGTPGNPSDGFLGQKSGYSVYDHVYWNETIPLPKGTTSIRMESRMEVQEHQGGEGAWFNASFSQIGFSGGKEITAICGYKEGEVVSASPAYGGSSYLKPGVFLRSSEASGAKGGDGNAALTSVSVGYLEELSLTGVLAADLAAPNAVDEASVTRNPVGKDAVSVSWQTPADNGTVYYHKAESYLAGSDVMLSKSNVTRNLLTSGIKGYYYIIDQAASTAAGSQNAAYLDRRKGESLSVPLEADILYLHLAAVDVAGNTGPTAHVKLGRKDTEVAWKLATDKLRISSEERNLYPAGQPDTYYVRCDGQTPFTLAFDSSILGQASASYQIGHTLFDSTLQEAPVEVQRYGIITPNHPMTDDTVITKADGLGKEITGDTILEGGAYTVTARSLSCRRLNVEQQFVLGTRFHGKTIHTIPVAGAQFKKEIQYTDRAADERNGLYLIGDGEAPVIRGAEILNGLDLIDRGEGTLTLHLSAFDDLSGVRDFQVDIFNQDNAGSRTYYPGEDGTITLDITKDSPLFYGDFGLVITATDQVGNTRQESYGATEFTLSAGIERMLSPHDPLFQTGESGILTIVTGGYADRVEVVFPIEMLKKDPTLNQTYEYEVPRYLREEKLEFMVPLYTKEGSYAIQVYAYKGGRLLQEEPALAAFEIKGTVTDDFRTRLR